MIDTIDPQYRRRPKRRIPPQEKHLSWLMLAVLAAIAAGVLLVQARFDESQWRVQSVIGDTPPSRNGENRSLPAKAANTAAGLKILSPPEIFTAATLSDKINGKAELYLTAGFESLETQRYALADDAAKWMERYVYDMGRYRNAFAVYSAQQRSNSEPLAVTADAYRSANGIFIVHGRYYVELIASAQTDALQTKMMDLAKAFTAAHAVEPESLPERGLFPQQHRVANSLALIAVNAFGLDGLDWVFQTVYRRNQSEATVFVSRRADHGEAKALADTFADYFIDFGGEALEPPGSLQSARAVAIMDTYELAGALGPYLFGVHEATDMEFAFALATEMQQAIQEDIGAP